MVKNYTSVQLFTSQFPKSNSTSILFIHKKKDYKDYSRIDNWSGKHKKHIKDNHKSHKQKKQQNMKVLTVLHSWQQKARAA